MRLIAVILPLVIGSCASTRIEGGIEYQGQHGTYRLTYDGKTVRPLIVLKDTRGLRK